MLWYSVCNRKDYEAYYNLISQNDKVYLTMPLSSLREDERKYSRVTRRLVVLVEHILPGRIFNITEVAQEVFDRNYPEFQIRREGVAKPISRSRVQDYIRYARDLGIIRDVEDGYRVDFVRRTSDAGWTQALSDCAREHLATQFGIDAGELRHHLNELIDKYFGEKRLPTPHNIVVESGIRSGRALEITKWSLAVYADGPSCPFSTAWNPLFVTTAIRDTADRDKEDEGRKNKEE